MFCWQICGLAIMTELIHTVHSGIQAYSITDIQAIQTYKHYRHTSHTYRQRHTHTYLYTCIIPISILSIPLGPINYKTTGIHLQYSCDKTSSSLHVQLKNLLELAYSASAPHHCDPGAVKVGVGSGFWLANTYKCTYSMYSAYYI